MFGNSFYLQCSFNWFWSILDIAFSFNFKNLYITYNFFSAVKSSYFLSCMVLLMSRAELRLIVLKKVFSYSLESDNCFISSCPWCQLKKLKTAAAEIHVHSFTYHIAYSMAALVTTLCYVLLLHFFLPRCKIGKQCTLLYLNNYLKIKTPSNSLITNTQMVETITKNWGGKLYIPKLLWQRSDRQGNIYQLLYYSTRMGILY